MLEFDGWAWQAPIQLDFNVPAELERVKELIREADVVTYSYSERLPDKFGLGGGYPRAEPRSY